MVANVNTAGVIIAALNILLAGEDAVPNFFSVKPLSCRAMGQVHRLTL